MASERRGSRVVLVILLVAVIAAAAGIFWLVRSSQPSALSPEELSAAQGDTPASAPAPAESAPASFASLVSSGEVDSIRLVGDSITAGYGTDGYVDPDITGETAVIYDDGAGTVHHETSAEANCWANAFRAWAGEHGVGSFANAGINGAFMTELAANPDAWLGAGADVIVVALGTNDAGYYGAQEFRGAAEVALAAAAARSKLVVVLSPVSDLRDASLLVQPAAALGDVLHALCDQNGYVFVDTRDAVTPEMFNADGLHPTSAGSLAIWDRLRGALELG